MRISTLPCQILRRAVTLTELLMVISIITILVGLSFYAFTFANNFSNRIESDTKNAIAQLHVNDKNQTASAPVIQDALPERIRGQYFVAFNPSVTDPAAEAQRLATQVGGQILHVYTLVIPGCALKCDDIQAEMLRWDPAVKSVDQDRYVYFCQANPKNIKRVFCNTDNSGAIGIRNGNPLPTSIFCLVNTRLVNPNNYIITGRVNLGNRYGGALTTVAVMDTGIDSTHPDLYVIRSIDFSGSNDLRDLNGHGTHVAGIIGARNSLANGGVVGVYPNAPLISLKVGGAAFSQSFKVPSASATSVYAALAYLAGTAPSIRVCVMPFATTTVDPVMNAFVDAAGNRGILMVGTPGDGSGLATTTSPASASQTIVVGGLVDLDGFAWSLAGVGKDDIYSTTSNNGPRVDFVAPESAGGANIVSTIPLDGMVANNLRTPYSGLVFGTPGNNAKGTSFACAHVGGMLAFIADSQTNVGYVFPGGITTFSDQMGTRLGAVNALSRLTHRAGWHDDVVIDGIGTRIPVANFYVNQFLP